MELSSSPALWAHGSVWLLFSFLVFFKCSNSDMVLSPSLLLYVVLLVLFEWLCHMYLPVLLGILLLGSACWYILGTASPRKMLPIAGKTVFVTGCDTGFGKATAQILHSMGFKVIASVLDFDSPGAKDLLKRCPERLTLLKMDLTKPEDIQKAQQIIRMQTAHTGLWALVNNAGYCAHFGDAELTMESTYRCCMEVNFFGTVTLTKVLLPLIRYARGRIITICSPAGDISFPYLAAYGASKAALARVMDLFRHELFPWGVKVSIIQPGSYKTEMTNRQTTWILMGIFLITCPRGEPEIIARPGPSSGILVQEAPGFILTDKRMITQKICTSVDPKASIEKRYDTQNIQSPEIQGWYRMHLKRAQTRVNEILTQARKPFVPISSIGEKRPKRFIGVLIAGLIFSVLGAVVSTTVSAANSISMRTLEAEIGHLYRNIEAIHKELEIHKAGLVDLISVVNDTVITVNMHSELINRSINLHQSHDTFKRELLSLQEPIAFHTLSFLDEIQNGMNDLTHGYIPLYFVSVEMIRALLRQVNDDNIEDFQINLAFEMGSAIPLYINPDSAEVCFLLAVPYCSSENVFQMKTIHNVGTWKENIHVQIKTPELIAYQPWIQNLYAIPILGECLRFKDNNFQCNGNPFIYDVTHALCGMEYLKHGSEKCEVNMRKSEDQSEVIALLVKDEWLVSTAAKNMSIFYKNQIMSRIIAVPSTVSLIRVPPNARITIGKTTLYPVGTDVWEGEVESIDAFQNQDIPIDPDLKFLLEHKPNHTVKMVIKKDNVSVDTYEYTEQDNLLIHHRRDFRYSDIAIYIVLGILTVWIIALTIHVRKINRNNRDYIPMVLKFIKEDLQGST